ncbi:MAG TPA: hypothetical protein ENK19_07850 [Acidobacteria bacterium]|nr:hypothetical protein [Acidobacteriota bacterium]
MIIALAVFLTFAAQWVLGLPATPSWLQWTLLPMVWIVGPPMRHRFDRVFLTGLGLGLAWDVLFDPVVGPGAIAWSATALVAAWTVRKAGDHTARSWALIGAGGALVVAGVRYLALLPLGLAAVPRPVDLGVMAFSTGLWCGLVAVLLGLDLPARIRSFRRSRLR